MACVSRFSLPFDEFFHVGVIQLHAQQWSPFFAALPESANQFSALSTDASYLYHYLMSFPYRLITLFTHNTVAIVVFLRLINIALFAYGLVIFRKALSVLGVSKSLNHVTLFVFAGLPITSFVAANINYDNLIFLLVGAIFLFSTQIMKELSSQKTLNTKSFLGLIIVAAAAPQVKYTMLAFVAPVAVYVGVSIIYYAFRYKKTIWKKTIKQHKSIDKRVVYLLLAGVVLVCTLGAARFGYNISTYHSLSPGCEKVLGENACKATSIWRRDQAVKAANYPTPTRREKVMFVRGWMDLMHKEQYTIISPYNGGNFLEPVRQLVAASLLFVPVGVVLLLFYMRRIVKAYPLITFYIFMAVFYTAVLFHKNYSDFARLGKPMALQGRYLLPIMVPVVLMIAMAYWFALKGRPQLKALLVVAVMAIGLQGGGAVTYILRVDKQWYWSKGYQLPYEAGRLIE